MIVSNREVYREEEQVWPEESFVKEKKQRAPRRYWREVGTLDRLRLEQAKNLGLPIVLAGKVILDIDSTNIDRLVKDLHT